MQPRELVGLSMKPEFARATLFILTVRRRRICAKVTVAFSSIVRFSTEREGSSRKNRISQRVARNLASSMLEPFFLVPRKLGRMVERNGPSSVFLPAFPAQTRMFGSSSISVRDQAFKTMMIIIDGTSRDFSGLDAIFKEAGTLFYTLNS